MHLTRLSGIIIHVFMFYETMLDSEGSIVVNWKMFCSHKKKNSAFFFSDSLETSAYV